MKERIFSFVTVIALAVLGSSVLLAESNPFIGTWKQDMAKSKYAEGGPVALSRTITYESQGDQIKSTHDAVQRWNTSDVDLYRQV